MTTNNEPMIRLDPGGKAPILSYNVPEGTAYSGRNFIELDFPPEFFKPAVKKKPSATDRTSVKNLDVSTIKSAVVTGMKSGFSDTKLFPNIRLTSGVLRFAERSATRLEAIGSSRISERLAQLDPEEVASMMQSGKRLNVYRSMFGTLQHNYIDEPVEVRPRLLIVETYRLSSYPGAYGAGKVLKTFSLLPGEKTKISVKTYQKRESDSKDASSILDSFTQESSDDFENSVQSEQSDKQTFAENFEYNAEAEAEASWGWGSGKASGGVKGGTNSAREEFAKNVSSATQKHSAKASAKRDVQINTSFEVKEESGEETSIEREIQNINVSRTLNFVFRQMNQEFISILHLVDVRVAFFNGFAELRREVALPQLDTLLDEVIVDAPKRQQVRTAIIDQLENIFDYQGQHHAFVETASFKDRNGDDVPNSAYLRVKRNYTSTYTDEITGTAIVVPGIILSADKNVLRTDGVIVEALLGHGDGLDQYSHGLQDETIRAKILANDWMQIKAKREELAQSIIANRDEAAAKLFQQVFPPPYEKDVDDYDKPGNA